MAALEDRILVLAPTGRDSELACDVLRKAGFAPMACPNLECVAEELRRGASALLLAEEGLSARGMPSLMSAIAGQPAWSDIPIVILTGTGEMNETRMRSLNTFAPSGNVTFLERPFRQMTLISTLKMALRARQRQYQLRGTLSSLGESEERLRLALDSGKIGAWEWNVRTNRLVGSMRFHDFLGLPEGTLRGGLESLISLIHADDAGAFRDAVAWAMEGGVDCEMEFRVLRPDRELRWLYTRAKVFRDRENRPVRVIGAAMDISERKQVEDDLRRGKETLLQSQKMEAIGKLAGGIAHDFNNMLTAINGYSELLLGQLNDPAALNIGLGEILRSGKRAAALTNQLLAYSRQQLMSFQAVDLNRIVEGMSGMLQRLLNEDIHHVVKLQADLPCIKADPSQMEQVVLNLALNARDAMPGGGGLEIETSILRHGGDGPSKYREVPSGNYVMLSVRDSGVGMSEEVKARIFEPFFTTKSLGKGTGMGLSTVYGIVRQSGGYIVVDTAPGRGSVFEVIFPAVVGADRMPQEALPAKMPRGRCRETIMVAEDESSVRVFLRQLLSAQGYMVLAAANGNEALEIARAYPGEIHLLITDVVMPGMGGRDLAERLGRERPSMRMLFISGYTDDAILHHGVLDGDTAFMNKPFPPASLLEKVRELLSVSSAQ
ncbi:MAG TPA: response regulator [Fibrobacteria bacterium]|nr:response regulator [Fibrobacteria bacterium]